MLQFSIATISVFVGLLNQTVKYISETCFHFDIKKYIPLFSIGFGILLGIIGYFTPSIEMGNNIVEAFFIGLASGAAATGIHQIGKQLTNGSISADVTPPADSTETSEDADQSDYNEDE